MIKVSRKTRIDIDCTLCCRPEIQRQYKAINLAEFKWVSV